MFFLHLLPPLSRSVWCLPGRCTARGTLRLSLPRLALPCSLTLSRCTALSASKGAVPLAMPSQSSGPVQVAWTRGDTEGSEPLCLDAARPGAADCVQKVLIYFIEIIIIKKVILQKSCSQFASEAGKPSQGHGQVQEFMTHKLFVSKDWVRA